MQTNDPADVKPADSSAETDKAADSAAETPRPKNRRRLIFLLVFLLALLAVLGEEAARRAASVKTTGEEGAFAYETVGFSATITGLLDKNATEATFITRQPASLGSFPIGTTRLVHAFMSTFSAP